MSAGSSARILAPRFSPWSWSPRSIRRRNRHPWHTHPSRSRAGGTEGKRCRYGSETRRYLPDFIGLVDDGHGDGDLLHLVVESRGYRHEDAKEKKAVPSAFAELTEIDQIDAGFKAKVKRQLGRPQQNGDRLTS